MEKIATLGFLFATISCSFGQITLTSDDFAKRGEAATVSSINASQLLGINISLTGPNSIWDFSYLESSSKKRIEFNSMSTSPPLPSLIFGQLANPEYQASYYTEAENPLEPFQSILPFPLPTVENFYQYSKLSADGLTLLGYSATSDGIPAISDVIEKKYELPLTYGDSYSSSGHTAVNLNPFYPVEWIQNRLRSTTVDGWGQLTTPFGTFNTVRLRHEINEIDSLNYSGLWLSATLPTIVEYEWWTKDEKIPILKVVTTKAGTIEQVTKVEYRDTDILATTDKGNLSVSVYPNPTSHELNINLPQDADRITVADMLGRIVFTDENPSLQNTYSLESLESGAYILTIKKGETVLYSSSIVKQP